MDHFNSYLLHMMVQKRNRSIFSSLLYLE